jgi:hypothetical protein
MCNYFAKNKSDGGEATMTKVRVEFLRRLRSPSVRIAVTAQPTVTARGTERTREKLNSRGRHQQAARGESGDHLRRSQYGPCGFRSES